MLFEVHISTPHFGPRPLQSGMQPSCDTCSPGTSEVLISASVPSLFPSGTPLLLCSSFFGEGGSGGWRGGGRACAILQESQISCMLRLLQWNLQELRVQHWWRLSLKAQRTQYRVFKASTSGIAFVALGKIPCIWPHGPLSSADSFWHGLEFE